MSKIYDFRDALKSHIVDANIGLDETDVIIERQADIMTNINTVVAKVDGNGVALTIGAARGRHVNPKSVRSLSFDVTFKIQLWVLPIYDQSKKAEEDIFEPLVRLLHGAQIGDSPHCSQTLHVEDFEDVPDPGFLLREITLTNSIHI